MIGARSGAHPQPKQRNTPCKRAVLRTTATATISTTTLEACARISFALPKRPQNGLHTFPPLRQPAGGGTGPQGGLPTDVSELRGGVHLRLYTRRRRNQRKTVA